MKIDYRPQDKHPLLRDHDIKVFWRDAVTGKLREGILWNFNITLEEIPMDEAGHLGPTKEINEIQYDVKGSDEKHYGGFDLKDLWLDVKDIAN